MQEVYRRAASILVLKPVEVCKPGPSTPLISMPTLRPRAQGRVGTRCRGRAGSSCETIYSILLLHKPRKKDAWQLPQGGVEKGENVTEAALRELNEEASLTGCTVIGVSSRVYQYDFPASFRRFRPDNVKGQRIEYVFALAPKDATVTVDGTEVDSSVWVDLSQLPLYIKRREYLEIVKELYEEALERTKG